MGRLVRGDVVIVPFPFTDLTATKRRPALVVARAGGDDVLLALITSQQRRDAFSVPLREGDFAEGGLRIASNVRPNHLFTADTALVLYIVGHVAPKKREDVADRIRSMLAAE